MDVDELRMWDELFSTAGWRRLVEQASEELEQLEKRALHDSHTYEDVALFRGQAIQLFTLIGLEDSILNMAKAAAEAEDAPL